MDIRTPQPKRAPKLLANIFTTKRRQIPFDNQPYKTIPQMRHLMSFQAHKNTLVQMSVEMHSQDLMTLGRDNTLKMWSVSLQKQKNLTSRLPQVSMALNQKAEISNRQRPGKRLLCFQKLPGNVLVTGGTDKVLRYYKDAMPEPSQIITG